MQTMGFFSLISSKNGYLKIEDYMFRILILQIKVIFLQRIIYTIDKSNKNKN